MEITMNKRKHACLILSFGICLALLTGCGGHSADDVMGPSGQSAAAIQLNGSTASSDSSDVRIKQSTVTITAAGTYVLNGTLDDGMIVVNTNKSADVQLILDGAAINSSTSAAIYIKQAGSVTVTTAEDSENSLSNGGVYEAVDDANVDAVIFSKADLTLSGLGNLTIHAAAGGGVVSKDALIVTDGTYTVTSEKDSLSGKDSVDIKGGVFTLVSDGDGISSDADLHITDGTFSIISGGGYENGETHRQDFFGASDDRMDIKMNDRPDGEISGRPDGEMSGRPDGEMGGRPDGEISGRPDGEMGGRPDGEMSGGPDGEMPDRPDGQSDEAERPVPEDMQPSGDSYDADNTDSPSTKGIKSDGNLIIGGGLFTLSCADDAIHTDGDLTVNGGSYELASGDDALHADGALTISNGNILISESYEGLEGAQITIDGGSIELTASDDGVNAATVEEDQTEDGCTITINGGSLLVNASGDGLDSNGSILQTGGEVYVCGPTDSANSALDFETEIRLDGGIMIAVDDSEMQERMNGASAQGVIRTRIDPQPAGTEIVLKDAEDNVLLSFTPKKTYSTVTVSCPDIVQGADYTLFAGNTIVNISMETLLYDDISSGFGRP